MMFILETMAMTGQMGDHMTEAYEIGSRITRELEQQGPCTLETLAHRLPNCSWNQMFMAIDGLSREGAITLQSYSRFQYLVSLASPPQHTLHLNAVGALPVSRSSYER